MAPVPITVSSVADFIVTIRNTERKNERTMIIMFWHFKDYGLAKITIEK